ncbi:MAG: helix-turn-helix transcriptional regulator [Clostridia bacterium]|nr:helix-turn-helix transcriptional regulator [Clostridia bacterium]
MVHLTKRLKDLREDHDETQRDIAALLKLPPQRISEWEKGFHEPRLEILISLADHWNVSLDYLCGLTSNPRHFRR